MSPHTSRTPRLLPILALILAPPLAHAAGEAYRAVERSYRPHPPAPAAQTWAEAEAKSRGCESCHAPVDRKTMHLSQAVVLGCTDCHGGDASVFKPQGTASLADPGYREAMERAHVLPRYPELFSSSANPERSYTWWLKESPEFVRFVNPGDLRVADEACGACHGAIVKAQKGSLMSTSAMLWGGAAYNNGILPYKRYILGEAYDREGRPVIIHNPVPVTPAMEKRGILPKLHPLPAWEVIPPADVFRVFERGGRNIGNLFPETGLPNALGQLQRLEEPGRPDIRQSNRGPGTGNRVAIPVLNIHKTRLNDPHLWLMGTNDQPGDWRHSGCTACHVVYANDRDPRHSGPYAPFGHFGTAQQADPTIPRDRPGHPLKHQFTRAIPTSQCMVCHMHQPNMFMNTYLGYTMWDYEPDAPRMWPKEQRHPDHESARKVLDRNPEGASPRGLWADVGFLSQVAEKNPTMQHTQFADYHGHGWNFRAVFKRDRKGHLLDAEGRIVPHDDPQRFEKAVHMSSIHADVGMHCVDCHFAQDMHSNGHLVGEVMAGIEITCKDCHGTVDAYPKLRTSGPMAPPAGRNLALLRNPDGKRRFEWVNGKLIQRSAVVPGLEWEVSLVKDTVTPGHPAYNVKAARAKLVARDTKTFRFGLDVAPQDRAHRDDEMLCYTCHTSWTTACAGCHLPIEANWKTERHHFEGGATRNWASYNPQVARDDMFQLGRHGEIKNGAIAPVRSSSALVLSSTNANREKIYIQQPPISAAGFSSQAFAPHYPHTERRTETKTCSDCHLSAAKDNNAIMAQLLLLGTRFVDFLGYMAYLGGESGIHAVRVTEWEEPQAVIGSWLHRYAYPDWFKAHEQRGRKLVEAYRHPSGAVGCLQHRGEYLFVAEGPRGMRVYDIAQVANKGFSQRIITAPFSPLGHDTHIPSKNATCVALPTNQPIHPARNQGELMRVINQEQPFHPIYHYAYITDAEEGLILTDVNTLADGEPRNNFLSRALTWNPDGLLQGARHLTIAGTWFYVATPRGIVVLDMDDPLKPRHAATIPLQDPRASVVQFRYLFATTARGLEVVDVTHPERPRIVEGAMVPLPDARKLHVARTYAYIAAGAQGLVIVDVERPEQPRLYQVFNPDGAFVDASDVTVASTNASLFAYVADGRGGLKVVQLMSPDSQPGFYGFSPEPKPELIAHYQSRDPLRAISRPLERDRAVDETGHQIAVLGRIGSRPFNLEEMRRLYLDAEGNPWFVSDDVEGPRGIATKPLPYKPNRILALQPDAPPLPAPFGWPSPRSPEPSSEAVSPALSERSGDPDTRPQACDSTKTHAACAMERLSPRE